MGVKLFDKFSFLHAIWGVISYTIGIRNFIIAIILHIIFEILENSSVGIYMIRWPGMKPKADNSANIIGDTISFGTGWCIAYLIFTYVSV